MSQTHQARKESKCLITVIFKEKTVEVNVSFKKSISLYYKNSFMYNFHFVKNYDKTYLSVILLPKSEIW